MGYLRHLVHSFAELIGLKCKLNMLHNIDRHNFNEWRLILKQAMSIQFNVLLIYAWRDKEN